MGDKRSRMNSLGSDATELLIINSIDRLGRNGITECNLSWLGIITCENLIVYRL